MRCLALLLLLAPFTLTLNNAYAAVGRDGNLDPGFASGGKGAYTFPGNLFLWPNGAVEVAVLPDGKLLLAGTVTNGAGDTDFAALRLQANGAVDTGYGIDGGRRVGFDRPNSSLQDTVVGFLVQADGKAVLVGYAAGDPATDEHDMAVVRLTEAGALDNSFGSGGRVLVPFNLGSAGRRDDRAHRIAQQADGKLLLVGQAEGPTHVRMAIVRLTTGGQRDTTFDGDGRVDLDFGPDYTNAQGLQIQQLPDGRILVAGTASRILPGNVPSADFAVVRLLANGSPDPSFGIGGKATYDFAIGGDHQDLAYDVDVLADGRAVVCGAARANAPNNFDMACLRLMPDGTPDPAFGQVLVPFDRGGDLQDVAVAVARDSQDRLLLAGPVRRLADNDDFGVARLRPDGQIDPAFGASGQVVYNSCIVACVPGEYNNTSTSMALQADGKIVLAGWVANNVGSYRFMVMRLLGDVIFSAGFEP